MRIGLVIERMDPSLGGAEQWTYHYVKWLVAEGHDVHLIARSVHRRVQGLKLTSHELHCGSRIEFAVAAEQKARSLALDIVHDMGRGWYCDVFHPHSGSWTAASRQKLQAQPAWRRSLKRPFQRVLPRHRQLNELTARQYVSDHRLYIALAHRVASHFETLHGVATEQIRRIYNGVDTQRFSPELAGSCREPLRKELGIASDDVLLLFVAHNFTLKGLPTLMRSLAQLREQYAALRLIVVGGKRLRGYQRMASHLGIADRVSLIGSVDDTAPYYASADLFVLPTYYDPCSLVVLEALASGLPVITSQYNGVAELMTDGVEGFVMQDPGDPAGLASLLRRLMAADLRREMGLAARRLAEAHSLTNNFHEIMQVYREVLRRKRAA